MHLEISEFKRVLLIIAGVLYLLSVLSYLFGMVTVRRYADRKVGEVAGKLRSSVNVSFWLAMAGACVLLVCVLIE